MPTNPFGDIKNAAGERIDFTYEDGGKSSGPLVVIGHGVTANKDRPWALTLAKALNAARFATVRLSFSGNGESGGDFRDSTVTKEVSDLTAVLDAVDAPHWPLVYVGHSMGGAVGLIAAAQDERIKALVSLAGMVDCADFVRRKFADLTPGQDVMWGKTECPVSQAFVDDMNKIGTLLPRATEVRVPWLLVHGTADTVVPFAESLAIVEAATNAPTEWVELGGADHLFSGPDEPVMAAAVVSWLQRQDL